MEELHVDDVQKLLVQLTDIDDVAGQKAGFRSVDGTENMLLISQLHTTVIKGNDTRTPRLGFKQDITEQRTLLQLQLPVHQ